MRTTSRASAARWFMKCVAVLCAATACDARSDEARASADLELEQLLAADQADRRPPARAMTAAEVESQIREVVARDSARRQRVREMVSGDMISTPAGFARAAMIINHAHDSVSYLAAHALALRGLAIDPMHRDAGQLAALTADNLRWKRGEPTWYSIKTSGGLRQPPVAHPFDSTRVTDAERLRIGFDSAAKQHRETEALIRNWKPMR